LIRLGLSKTGALGARQVRLCKMGSFVSMKERGIRIIETYDKIELEQKS